MNPDNYRYRLERDWWLDYTDDPVLRLGWIMLNPSTADNNTDDPTIRKCCGFARHNRFNGIRVANLFAARSTDPAGLQLIPNLVGDENAHRQSWWWVAECDVVVFAWGRWGDKYRAQALTAASSVAARTKSVVHLGLTKSGQPRHPLMVPYAQPLVPWSTP